MAYYQLNFVYIFKIIVRLRFINFHRPLDNEIKLKLRQNKFLNQKMYFLFIRKIQNTDKNVLDYKLRGWHRSGRLVHFFRAINERKKM